MNLSIDGRDGKPASGMRHQTASIQDYLTCLITKNKSILLAMRLTFILLTLAFLQVSAKGTAQQVSLSGKDMPLLKVFESIKSQTGFVFFYDANLLQQGKPVTLNVKRQPLETTLAQVFDNQPLSYSIVNKTITITAKNPVPVSVNAVTAVVQEPAFAKVSGTITDENGLGLNGASIMVKGSSNGVKTDAEHKTRFCLPPGRSGDRLDLL